MYATCRGRRPLDGTWTQTPSNISPYPLFGHSSRALRLRLLQTLSCFCDSIGPYNPGASAPLFLGRKMGLTPPFQRAACAAHLGLAGIYDPSDTLNTDSSVRGARAPSFTSVAGGIYAPTLATSVSPLPPGWLGFTTRAERPHHRNLGTTTGPHRYRWHVSSPVSIVLL